MIPPFINPDMLTWIPSRKSKALMEFDKAIERHWYQMLCGAFTVYKLHIAKDFIDKPELIHNNGPAIGSHVFLSYEAMLDSARFGGQVFWYCECLVTESGIERLTVGMAKMLTDGKFCSYFKPVPLWEK